MIYGNFQRKLGLPDSLKVFQGHFVVYDYWNFTSCLLWMLFRYSSAANFFKQKFLNNNGYFLRHICLRWNKSTRYSVQLRCLLCTDDDNRSYRNVCNMSFVSFASAVILVSLLILILECSVQSIVWWCIIPQLFTNFKDSKMFFKDQRVLIANSRKVLGAEGRLATLEKIKKTRSPHPV